MAEIENESGVKAVLVSLYSFGRSLHDAHSHERMAKHQHDSTPPSKRCCRRAGSSPPSYRVRRARRLASGRSWPIKTGHTSWTSTGLFSTSDSSFQIRHGPFVPRFFTCLPFVHDADYVLSGPSSSTRSRKKRSIIWSSVTRSLSRRIPVQARPLSQSTASRSPFDT